MTEKFGPYVILSPLGKGAMGQVDLALDSRSGERVAVKRILPKFTQTPQLKSRFVREGKIACAIKHENVVETYEFGELDGQMFLVSEYIQGFALSELLKSKQSLSEKRGLEVIRDILKALDFLDQDHRRIIHRDIKPSNILLTAKGQAKLCDLGLARATAIKGSLATLTKSGGTTLGTPSYIAPEQIDYDPTKDSLDCRCDLYSLGATLFHLLAGSPPFNSKAIPMLLIMHKEYAPPILSNLVKSISKETSELVNWLLQKEPKLRPQTPGIALQLIEEILRNPQLNASSDVAAATTKDTLVLSREEPLTLTGEESCVAQDSLGETAKSLLSTVTPSFFQNTATILEQDFPSSNKKLRFANIPAVQTQLLGRAYLLNSRSGHTLFIYAQTKLQLGRNEIDHEGQDICLRYRPSSRENNKRSLSISGKHFHIESTSSGVQLTNYSHSGIEVDGQRLKEGQVKYLKSIQLVAIKRDFVVEIRLLPSLSRAECSPAVSITRLSNGPEYSYLLVPEQASLVSFNSERLIPQQEGDLRVINHNGSLYIQEQNDNKAIGLCHGLQFYFDGVPVEIRHFGRHDQK